MKLVLRTVPFLLLYSSVTFGQQCSSFQNPPDGVPDGFDINQELKKLEFANTVAEQAGFGPIEKASFMAINFGPHRPYDFKRSEAWPGSAEFGNWFFGAAAQILGYSHYEARQGAAVVQQYANLVNSYSPTRFDLEEFGRGLRFALETSRGDNPEDVPFIDGGYSYAEEIYKKDENSEDRSNSCDQSSAPTSTATEGAFNLTDIETPDGWSDSGFMIGFGCAGDCQTGEDTVTIRFGSITDMPDNWQPPGGGGSGTNGSDFQIIDKKRDQDSSQ